MAEGQPPLPVAALFERAREAQQTAAALAEVTRASRQAAQAARQPIRARAELIRASQTARLLARLQTMPVIEQAKGIIISQSGCSPEAAFDMLRQASQRSNVPIRELAATIVTNATQRSPGRSRHRPAPVTHWSARHEQDGGLAAEASA